MAFVAYELREIVSRIVSTLSNYPGQIISKYVELSTPQAVAGSSIYRRAVLLKIHSCSSLSCGSITGQAPLYCCSPGGGESFIELTPTTRHLVAFGHSKVVLFYAFGYLNNSILVCFIIFYIICLYKRHRLS